MKTLLRLLLKSQHQRNRSGPAQTEKGMTLVELLVGAIMAFLIITPMLGFVVDMLNTDRREQVKSNTEQDLQAAVDFIAQDLSQAIYIYDQAGITAINPGTKLPPAPANTTGTPILVFWKRQLIKNAVPINSAVTAKTPSACPPNGSECNDTYVLSLVAYYQIRDTTPNSIWCQPSGGNCPTRIARYEIREPVRNPYTIDVTKPYYDAADLSDSQKGSEAFNKDFDFNKPTVNVTMGANFPDPQVLVNYIHHNSTNVPIPTGAQCQTLLAVTPPPPPATFNANDLLITDASNHSFYSCVDTSKNIARVTIRGNSLRRLQTDADYDANKAAYFPTATVQVQGLGGLGK
ncbi:MULTISPECIES: hormogonium polysaccharide secretion pseudopilin HpsC [unclassified Microcoleus]|uniref:hormogonium polysaccharide secretion pseudopilin HpsC n=1 Tax=unclassified Microcoleus TaxID=2642155 RepID=UPI002FD553CE